MTLQLVVPPLDGPVTGGTRFNRELVAALRRRGESVAVADVYAGPGLSWVDSLFMGAVAGWAREGRVAMLLHWLPSLVAVGPELTLDAITTAERDALHHAEAFVVPSPFLAEVLGRLGVDAARVGIVEPGAVAPASVPTREPDDTVRAVVVANVTEGKGVAELLEALAPRARPGLRVVIVGSTQVEPAYAARAAEAARGIDVAFVGAVPHAACLEEIAGSDVLVSASRMESYGMAIADARACGVPVVARAGGNVEHLVDARTGGEVVAGVAAVADALLHLVEDRAELERRRAAAQAGVRTRSWDEVARDFSAFASARQ